MPTKSKSQGGPKGVNSGSRLGAAKEVANVWSPMGLGTTDVATYLFFFHPALYYTDYTPHFILPTFIQCLYFLHIDFH